jgi:galactonate dehydratase
MNPAGHDRVSHCRLTLARVTPKTIWAFLETTWASGLTGSAEVTLPNREKALVDAFERLDSRYFDGAAREAQSLDLLAEATILNGLAFARADAEARAAGRTLRTHLGGIDVPIPVYANINRRTIDRSPEGFHTSARHALAAGFTSFKIAPFDEVTVKACETGEGKSLMRTGLDRIAAVRDAIGKGNDLMVDCHWRFDPSTAATLVDAIKPYDLHWLECPLPEVDKLIPDLKMLRSRLNSGGTRLAGLEEFVGVESFLRFAAGDAYDVMMPDVKYVGGPETLRKLSRMLAERKVEVSPHNPTGPLCHAVSAHVCGMVEGFTRLEMQIDETPRFDALVQTPCPAPEGGFLKPPEGTGHGMTLDADMLRSLTVLTSVRSF